jgi:hypothetical protein
LSGASGSRGSPLAGADVRVRETARMEGAR